MKNKILLIILIGLSLPIRADTPGQIINVTCPSNQWISSIVPGVAPVCSGGGGGSGANQYLSNLLSPTAVNEDIVAGSDNAINLGSGTFGYTSLYVYTINANAQTLNLLGSDVNFLSGALDLNQTYVSLAWQNVSLSLIANSLQLSDSVPFLIGTTDVTGTSPDNYPGDLILVTGDNNNEPTPTQPTGSMYLLSGSQDSSDSSGQSGEIYFQTGGTAGSGSTGLITFQTGNINGTGFSSGPINFNTGNGPGTSSSGYMEFATGGTTDSASGGYSMSTGAAQGLGNSGAFNLSTGSVATGTSGGFDLLTGVANDQFGNSGDINLITGQINGGTGIELPNAGNVFIGTGNASGSNDGNITLGIGQGSPSAPPHKGYIQFQDGTQGTSGYVWTSIDNQGSGAWMPGSSGSFAPFEILTDYSSYSIGEGTFAGNSSDDDQSRLLAQFGSTDSDNPSNSTSTVGIFAGTLTNASLNPGVQPGGIYLQAGNVANDTSGNQINGGFAAMFAGNSEDGTAGGLNLGAGSANTGFGGEVFISGGNSNTAAGGDVVIASGGSGTTNDGAIVLNTQAGVAPGTISLQDGSEGTPGYVWTSIDDGGTGSWIPAGEASFTPFEILPEYASITGQGSFAGNESDNDQSLFLVQFGSTDTNNPSNSTSSVNLVAGALTNVALNPGVFAGGVNISGGNVPNDTSGNAVAGGAVTINGGTAQDGNGGAITLNSGNSSIGSGAGNGGNFLLLAGSTNGTGTGGSAIFAAGGSNSNIGGEMDFYGGSSDSANGGNMVFSTGFGFTAPGFMYFQVGGTDVGNFDSSFNFNVDHNLNVLGGVAITGGRSDNGYTYNSSTGDFTISNFVEDVIVDAGSQATLNVTMPATPSDGQLITISFPGSVTLLTILPNSGQSILGAPTTAAANSFVSFIYVLSNNTWYRRG